ncbi:MAG: hypothetical protein ACRD1L_11405, partial [Terriglobales bacterium]
MAAAVALAGSVVLAAIAGFQATMDRAGREMVFCLDEQKITRRRAGHSDVGIPFAEISVLRQGRRWLAVESVPPARKIIIPVDLEGFAALRVELGGHCAIAPPGNVSILSSRAPYVLLLAVAGWSVYLAVHGVAGMVAGGVVAVFASASSLRRLGRIVESSAGPILG